MDLATHMCRNQLCQEPNISCGQWFQDLRQTSPRQKSLPNQPWGKLGASEAFPKQRILGSKPGQCDQRQRVFWSDVGFQNDFKDFRRRLWKAGWGLPLLDKQLMEPAGQDQVDGGSVGERPLHQD